MKELCLLLFLKDTSGAEDNEKENDEDDGNDGDNDANLLAVGCVVR